MPVRRRGDWLTISTRVTLPRPAMVAAERIRLAHMAGPSMTVQSPATTNGVR